LNNSDLTSYGGLKVGDMLPNISKCVQREQLVKYSEVSGDKNPIHLSDDFAKTTQFGGIIAHGMLTLAFVSELMTNAFGSDWLRSGCLKVRFKGAAYLGDRLLVSGEISQVESSGEITNLTCSVSVEVCRNEQSVQILNGTAKLTVGG